MENRKPTISSLLDPGLGSGAQGFLDGAGTKELAETMAAMANTDGGTIIIGATPDNGEIQGVADTEKTIDQIFEAALQTDPPLILPMPAVVQVANMEVVRLGIPAGLPNIYTVGGRFLGREGRHTSPIPARTLRRKLIERGSQPFEARVPDGAGPVDLDQEAVEDYIAGLQHAHDSNPQTVLFRRGCLVEEDGRYYPTLAGLLLFGKYPQQWLPNAFVLAARFPGPTLADEFVRQEIAGTIPQQIRLAEKFVRENLQTVVRLVGLTRQETLEYPPESVRELIVNAVAHRDYGNAGDSVHLHIFSNRLEVHSPGGLPGPVNLENLLQARFSRNPVIVQVLSDMGFIERLGYGLDRVVNAQKAHNLKPPQFQEIAGTFRVLLPKTPLSEAPQEDQRQAGLADYAGLGLNPRQEAALGHINQNSRITNSEFQELCPDVHAETLRRDLAALVRKGLIMKVGSKRGTYYISKDAG